ncbi:DUF4352 domain-containing protein [Allobranchiibius sp. GilTou38]|uniref:DUF4352 domain-containing protein n=1 Tax=Allobranchiibius sp. GilTou38 TaxID=2815210 RepID=UPI001AA160E9|nr:DUF4352 domain-containing protein [Allobranchiibius sp. GilTou38]MBO1765385.1 DUF4352 domain-containing protein [Allobranchiibius sp. GilTou38]
MSQNYPPPHDDRSGAGRSGYPGQGGQGGQGGPPGSWNPPAPPPPPNAKRNWFVRHKVITVIGAVVVIGTIAGVANGGGSSSASDPSATGTAASSAATSAQSSASASSSSSSSSPKSSARKSTSTKKSPGLNTPVKDGKLQFVVTRVRTGVSSVGNQYLGQKAQGQYVLVSVTVTNLGKDSQTLSDSDQEVKDSQGRTFKADSTADLHITGNQVLFSQINPGNSTHGVFAFDMPIGATPVSIELHDTSFFSDGATVSLR